MQEGVVVDEPDHSGAGGCRSLQGDLVLLQNVEDFRQVLAVEGDLRLGLAALDLRIYIALVVTQLLRLRGYGELSLSVPRYLKAHDAASVPGED